MCGRARCALARDQVLAAAGLGGRPERMRNADRFQPSHNLAPGHWVPVLRRSPEDGALEVCMMRWGLVPSGAKPDDKMDFWKMFNARSETLCEKAVFSRLLAGRRCVVLLQGFYEWKKEGSKKQPYYVHLNGQEVVCMAGLYDVCSGPEGPLPTVTLITTDSCKPLEWLHNRMPVLLTRNEVDLWLGKQEFNLVGKVCRPYSGTDLAWHPVTPAMSDLSYNRPDCSVDLRTKKGSITSFFGKKQGAGGGKKEEGASGSSALKKEEGALEAIGVKKEGEAAGSSGVKEGEAAGSSGVKEEGEALGAGDKEAGPSGRGLKEDVGGKEGGGAKGQEGETAGDGGVGKRLEGGWEGVKESAAAVAAGVSGLGGAEGEGEGVKMEEGEGRSGDGGVGGSGHGGQEEGREGGDGGGRRAGGHGKEAEAGKAAAKEEAEAPKAKRRKG